MHDSKQKKRYPVRFIAFISWNTTIAESHDAREVDPKIPGYSKVVTLKDRLERRKITSTVPWRHLNPGLIIRSISV